MEAARFILGPLKPAFFLKPTQMDACLKDRPTIIVIIIL